MDLHIFWCCCKIDKYVVVPDDKVFHNRLNVCKKHYTFPLKISKL